MRFSVVIPLYNKAPYIKRALDSVLVQTVPDFEVVVVDDGSTDGGTRLVREYTDPRIRLVKQINAGVSAARNRGIAESKADLIAFLDGDDQWDQDFLEQISFLTKNYPSAGLFATSYRTFNGITTQYPKIKDLNIPFDGHGILENYLRVMLGHVPFYTSSTVVRKEILQKIEGFPVGVAHGEDLDTWLRIHFTSPMAFLYSHTVVYSTNLPSSATDGWIPDDDFAPVRTAQKFINSGLCDEKLIEDLQEYIAYYQLEIAKILVLHGKHDRARLQLRRIQKTRRFAYKKILWVFWSFIPNSATKAAFRIKVFFRQLGQLVGSGTKRREIKQGL